jgi:collagenase-like PrtC family protease
MELICPAGTPSAFMEALAAGADAIYCGFPDETNARNFPGLNFSRPELERCVAAANRQGVKTFVALNTFMRAGSEEIWYRAADDAVRVGVDALILADFGLMSYVAERYPEQRLHVSVQASASNAEAVRFLVEAFAAKRVVLPRVLTVSDISLLARRVDCELEVFAFGGLCVMAEGRCSLSSYATGKSPNMNGVCSPPSHVRYRDDRGEMVSELGAYTINRPTLCKGRFNVGETQAYAFEDPVSLDVLEHLEALKAAGVVALKIEGRQRGKAYVAEAVSTMRKATAATPAERRQYATALARLSEGQQTTSGAYDKRWR